ncbi:MAG: DUF5312 domain-containing protein [Treponema sp.]|jgi:hypothetical protein|nr:DUF5312 domain-containing protein [Treponema sp.]
MSDSNTFNNLSSSLPHNERLKLLKKLGSFDEESSRPLIALEKEISPAEKSEVTYARLPWHKRIWFIFLSFFSGKTPLDMYINSQISNIGRSIDQIAPATYDWQKCMLRQNFHTELKRLKDAARFFYNMMDSRISRDLGEFLVFLGSFEMQELHAKLSEKTSPENFMAANPGISDIKLRQTAINYIETEINNISKEHRVIMYDDAHTIFCLKQLSSYLFERFIMSFSHDNMEMSMICPAGVVKSLMVTLNNILFSIKNTPSVTLLSAMFMFHMSKQENDDDDNMESELQEYMKQAEKAIDVIRSFNQRVPLTRILRCIMRDTTYSPSELAGGENWIVLFRASWIENATHQFNEFIKDRYRTNVQELYIELFGDFVPDPFENVSSGEDDNDSGIPVNNIKSISYLLIFHKLIFMPIINVYIRPILIDGDFEKKENKIEFTEAYNVLIKLDDVIKTFARRIEKNGDMGRRWAAIMGDAHSITVRHRKSAAILEEINHSADAIILDAQKALLSLENILGGILNPGQEKYYSTLSNMAKISGKGTQFTDGLKEGREKLKQMLLLIKTISDINEME